MKNNRLIAIALPIVLLLLVPLIAMQFTDEVNWTLADFIVAGALLFTTAVTCDFVIRKVTKLEYRIAICLTIVVILLIVWAELAVGLFGTPFGGS